MRILLIDDNPADLALGGYLLRRAGHVVSEAASGSAAMRSIRDRRPDVVATDLRMPGAIDGYQVLHLIRADPSLRDLRTVAVTANSTPTTTERAATAAGFDGYIHKPFGVEAFADAVAGTPAAQDSITA